jgi:hypothetical protein
MEERDWLKNTYEIEAESKAETEKRKKLVNDEDFITSWPLHVPAAVEGFHPPKQISFVCEGKCRKETTWTSLHEPTGLSTASPDKQIHSVSYICNLCEKSFLTIIYRADEFEEKVIGGSTANPDLHMPPSRVNVLVKVSKVGQYPPLSINISTALQKSLGKEATTLYKKALITRNEGYGLAAVGYIRRVVEDKTNELIEVATQLAEFHKVDAATVAKMRAAANSEKFTPYEDKLKIAGAVFPDVLKVGDINPLQALYGLVSKGIHSMTETECVDIADRTFAVFEYIFSKLKAEIADAKAFVEKVKKLS